MGVSPWVAMKVLVSLLLTVSLSSLGQLNLKICGGSLPEVCCSIVNIANFANINEGIVYDYSGEHELEDCWNYSLQAVNTIDQFQLTVYHEGSDGGQLDYVEVATSDNRRVHCNLGDWMDEFDSVIARDCRIM